MKSLVLVSMSSLAALALALTGCGGDDSSSPDAATSGDPSVSVTATPTSIAAGGTTTLAITVQNFDLVDFSTHTTNVAGQGHYHVYLDDADGTDYLTADFATSVQVTIPAGTAAGAHTLRIELYNNDHSDIPNEAHDIVDITVTTTAAIAVHASANPTTVTHGSTTTLAITADNFSLVDFSTHSTNQAGQGHYHVYLDGATGSDYLAADFQASVQVTIPGATTAGSHTLHVVLENNDHTPIAPPVSTDLPITVQ